MDGEADQQPERGEAAIPRECIDALGRIVACDVVRGPQ